MSNAAEMALEALPGGVFQSFILLGSNTRTVAAFVSIVLSSASTGFTAASMSYDFDTSVSKRRNSPKMYGYLPDEGRGVVFVLMFLLSVLQLVAKVFSTALLALTNPLWLIIWVSGDLLFYLGYKLARRDFIYFTPFKGITKYIMSFMERMVGKVLVDYTGLMLLRGPYGKRGSLLSLCVFS